MRTPSVCVCVIRSGTCSNYPSRASEQSNVIGSVRMCTKKIVIERTRDLIYLKFVAKDFFPKIITSSASENAGDSV